MVYKYYYRFFFEYLLYVFKAETSKKDVKKGREPKNQVHQEAILVETIRKEMAEQKLYTNYSVNPFKKCIIHRIYNH